MNNLSPLMEFRERTRIKSPRPQTWDDVIGNDVAKEQLREGITAAKKLGRPMPHTIIFGPPGTGKSTLSKIAAREMGGYFLETTASTFETSVDVIRTIWQLNMGWATNNNIPSTLFMDEIHMLGQAKGRQAIDQESIFPLLEDWEFSHNLIGKSIKDESDGKEYTLNTTAAIALPFTCIGATTEPGMLSQPLLRRFLLHVELQPYTEPEIAAVIAGAARRLEWKLTDNAAADLARVSRRNPGTALQLLTSANSRAVATDRTVVDDTVVAEIVGRLSLYPLGLTRPMSGSFGFSMSAPPVASAWRNYAGPQEFPCPNFQDSRSHIFGYSVLLKRSLVESSDQKAFDIWPVSGNSTPLALTSEPHSRHDAEGAETQYRRQDSRGVTDRAHERKRH